MTIQEKVNLLKQLKTAEAESKLTPTYQELLRKKKEAEDAIKDIDSLLAEDIKLLEIDVLDYFRNNRLISMGGVKAKTRRNKKVVIPRVLEALHGDVGMLMEIVKITQKDLEEYIKNFDEVTQQRFLNCIEVDSVVLVGLELE